MNGARRRLTADQKRALLREPEKLRVDVQLGTVENASAAADLFSRILRAQERERERAKADGGAEGNEH